MAKKKKQAPEPEQKLEQKELPKVPKEGNPLLTILTILLVLVGLGELGLWGYYGFGVFRDTRALRQYEEEQQALAEDRKSGGTAAGGSFGPTLKVENGSVTWRREEDRPIGGGGTLPQEEAASLAQGGDDGTRLARISMPKIPYLLADMGEDTQAQPPAQGTEPAGGNGLTTA